jgi:hypothetical protein
MYNKQSVVNKNITKRFAVKKISYIFTVLNKKETI